MTPPYRKKLIEIALPLKAINQASAREKSIRHGHPSTSGGRGGPWRRAGPRFLPRWSMIWDEVYEFHLGKILEIKNWDKKRLKAEGERLKDES
jgi:hypothetical protein